MARKTSNFQPSEECLAALARITDTANICAAALFGEEPTPDKASPRALRHALGMIYFLMRIDPRDLAALTTGPGSLADCPYTPFPPGYRNSKPVFFAG